MVFRRAAKAVVKYGPRVARASLKAVRRWRRGKGVIKSLEPVVTELMPGIKPHLRTITNVSHSLALATRGPQGKPLQTPLFGAEIKAEGSGNISRTTFKAKLNKLRKSNKSMDHAQRFEMLVNSSYRLTSGIGLQGIGDMTTTQAADGTNFTAYQFATYGGDIFIANNSKNAGALSGLNQLLLGDDTSSVNSTLGTSRIYQKSCFLETEISNLSAYPIEVDIYEVIAKHDFQGSGSYTGANFIQGTGAWSPGYFWQQGMVNYTTQVGFGGSKSSFNNLGTFPTSSELFNCYWTVQSRFKVSLAVGGVHIHESDYIMDQFIDTQRSEYSALIGGVTRSILLVLTGTPVRDSVTSSKVAIGPATIDVTHVWTYKAEGIPYNRMSSTLYNYTPTLGTPETTVQSSPTVSTTLNPD